MRLQHYLAICVCCLSVLAARADIELVQNGQNPCPILFRAEATQAEKDAANELAAYLKKMSGADFTAVAAADPLPARAVLVGAFNPALTQDLREDGFVLKTDNQRLYIAGGNPGLWYGVYEVLERLGCRWWSHDEEDVPSTPTLRVSNLNVVSQSPFTLHNIMSREASSFSRKSRMAGVENFTGSHNLQPMLKGYSETHPEILPYSEKTGQRAFNNLHYCYLAPGIVEELADRLARQVEARNGNLKNAIYFAGMGDWYGGMCECPDCKKVYEEEAWTDPDGRVKPGYTATLLRMLNKTAEILDQKYPGIKVGTFAYMSLEAPPAKTAPRSNVHIRVPRLRHCTVHAAPECDKNASFRRNLERWCELAPSRVYIWDYGVNYTNFLYPFPCINAMAENIRYYQRLGIKGVMIQGNYVTTGGDLVVPRNYLWSKLLWNPALETNRILEEFCDGYYGPASKSMLAYVAALEESVRKPEMIHADEFAKDAVYLTAAARARLAALREKAIAAARGQEPYDRRVREATNGMEILTLDTARTFKEVDGLLVKSDADAATYARALDVVKYNRNSGVNEWNTGRSYWMNFLARQGGPVVTLAEGKMTAKVAPLIFGQIRQVEYQGKPLLYLDENPSGGGSLINGFGTTPMRVVDTPAANRVKMQYAIEIGKWAQNSRQNVWQTIAVGGDDTLTVTGTAAANTNVGQFTVSTSYPVEGNIAAMHIACLTKEGEWQAVTLAPEVPKPRQKSRGDIAEVPEATGVRLLLPAQKCLVVDQYDVAKITGITVLHEKEKQKVTVMVQVAAAGAMKEREQVFLTRIMRVEPR